VKSAESAFARSINQSPSLPLSSDATAIAAEQRGRKQMRGMHLILLSRIRPDPTQPRKVVHDELLEEMAASVRRLGLLQPIAVRYIRDADIYQIISGERRYHAAKRAGLTEVPCWIQEPKDDEILIRQVVENWQRAQLHPFEIADALARLRDTKGYSQKKLATETGKSEAEISKLLKLLELAPDVQKEARDDQSGTLSFKHLYQIARLDADTQAVILGTVQTQHLSAVETEKLVRRSIERRTTEPKRGAPVTRVQYVTTKAKVVLTFRKQTVQPADILAALDEARAKADPTSNALNIQRVKSV
jgi:ParB family chromosome partitioning protein